MTNKTINIPDHKESEVLIIYMEEVFKHYLIEDEVYMFDYNETEFLVFKDGIFLLKEAIYNLGVKKGFALAAFSKIFIRGGNKNDSFN